MQQTPDPSADITDAERDRLWDESGENEIQFLAALTAAGYGHSRLAGQVNLLIHILDRCHQLGWKTYPAIVAETGISYETLRKLRFMVRDMQERTKLTIATSLGWTRNSVDLVLAMGEPVLIADWTAYSERTPVTPDPRRGVFARLALGPADLEALLRRYDLGDEPTRQLAEVVARVLTEDIDQQVRALLLQAARNTITRTLAAERDSTAELAAQLDSLPRGHTGTTG